MDWMDWIEQEQESVGWDGDMAELVQGPCPVCEVWPGSSCQDFDYDAFPSHLVHKKRLIISSK